MEGALSGRSTPFAILDGAGERRRRRSASPMFFLFWEMGNRRARVGWTLKKRRNSCEPTSKERLDVGIKRFAGYRHGRNRGRWVSLKIGLVRHALCAEDSSPSAFVSFARPCTATLFWASPCIYSPRLFHPVLGASPLTLSRALNSTAPRTE